MTTNIDFILDKHKKISIVVPDVSSKFNYYYEPTENLNRFDRATVYFICEGIKLKIGEDIFDEYLYSINGKLKKSLSNALQLPKTVNAGEMGYALNCYLNDLITIPMESFWLLSGNIPPTSVLMYNSDNKIYIEIVPIYPWTFREHEGEGYIPFEEWMKTYKPYAVEVISHATAVQWLEKSGEYLKLIGCEPCDPKEEEPQDDSIIGD